MSEQTTNTTAPAVQLSASIDLTDLKFLTVAEVATVLRLSKMTVYRLVKDGTLESRRVGRSYRIPVQAARNFIEGETTSPS